MKQFLTAVVFICAVLAARAADGFHTDGTRLLDAYGNEFVMRGCNYSYAWQNKKAASVIPAAKRIGCNTVRIQLGTGKKFKKCSAAEVESLIRLCEDNKLIAVFNTHDETGSDNVDDLLSAVEYWISLKDILNAHCSTVLLNISNEWCGSWSSKKWAEGYTRAIPRLREAGIKNTLIVDCGGWGQMAKCIWEKGAEVMAADCDNNTVFSIHMYQNAAGTAADVRSNIDKALATGFPLIIGEFAYQHGGAKIAWQEILDYTAEKNVSYLVWSWTGNSSDVADCDMFAGYDESNYKENGRCTVLGRNGIQQTSRQCSVYGSDSDTPGGDSEIVYDDEVIIDNPDADISGWDVIYHLTPDILGTVGQHDIIRLHIDAAPEAQLQVAYATEESGWNQYIDYTAVSAPLFDLKLSSPALLHGANYNGIYFKGIGYTIKSVGLLKARAQAGVQQFRSATDPIDYSRPYEVYTIDGRRVNEVECSGLYIIRQGSRAEKQFIRR